MDKPVYHETFHIHAKKWANPTYIFTRKPTMPTVDFVEDDFSLKYTLNCFMSFWCSVQKKTNENAVMITWCSKDYVFKLVSWLHMKSTFGNLGKNFFSIIP